LEETYSRVEAVLMIVVDGHEDLAWNVLTFGRDYTRSVQQTRQLERNTEVPDHNGQTLLGWPEWVDGRVAIVFATLFAAPERHSYGAWDTVIYRDRTEAEQLYLKNLDVYQRMVQEHPDKFALITSQTDLDQVLAGWAGDEPSDPRLGLVILMEGADGVQRPEDAFGWYERGVRILGPAWAGTYYAGGTYEPGPLTAPGRELLARMAEAGLALDLSHMSDDGALEALDLFEGVVLISHSNPAGLLENLKNPERAVGDDVIRLLAQRDGVLGITPYLSFIVGDWEPKMGREAAGIDDMVIHIDYICQLTGSADHVAIGTDFDGGYGLDKTIEGLDSVADLRLIGSALHRRGYSSAQVEGILGGNWIRMLRRMLAGK
jgi:membrane dipeptidase